MTRSCDWYVCARVCVCVCVRAAGVCVCVCVCLCVYARSWFYNCIVVLDWAFAFAGPTREVLYWYVSAGLGIAMPGLFARARRGSTSGGAQLV